MKAKLLEKLIDELSMMDDLGLSKEDKDEEPKTAEVKVLKLEKAEPEVEIEAPGEMNDEKSPLDMVEHSHEEGEPCKDDCPVRVAINKKLGR